MPLTIEAIPGARETLEEIKRLAETPGRIAAFNRFFFKYPNAQAPDAVRLCNVVFQGGGVLGLAHVGFLAGLEAADVRCAGLAGTSAGSIVATFVASVRKDDLTASTHERLLKTLSSIPMSSFIDGPPQIRNLIKSVLAKGMRLPWTLWPSVISAARRILARRGLNPGNAFERWLETELRSLLVFDNRTLDRYLAQIKQDLRGVGVDFADPMTLKNGVPVFGTDRLGMLRVIATGLPSGLKITFPEDLEFLDSKYMDGSPALFVRASMAIPAFFEPKMLEVNVGAWRKDVEDRLGALVSPNHVTDVASTRYIYLVDGGLLSNLPVDAFELMTHRQFGGSSQKFPTVVATLVGWTKPEPEATWRSTRRLFADVLRLAQAVQVQRDRDAWRRIVQSRGTSVRLVGIDITDHNWLNFSLRDAEMGQLFVKGLQAAKKFLAEL